MKDAIYRVTNFTNKPLNLLDEIRKEIEYCKKISDNYRGLAISNSIENDIVILPARTERVLFSESNKLNDFHLRLKNYKRKRFNLYNDHYAMQFPRLSIASVTFIREV